MWRGDRRLDIVQIGDPLLRSRARPLTPDEIRSSRIQRLVGDMRLTMRKAPGVGLAAPQVGEGLRLFVVEDTADYQKRLSAEQLAALARAPVPFHVVINPTLEIDDPTEVEAFEGCLSVHGLRGLVKRARAVTVSGVDECGAPVVVRASGWHARILQHEHDHLEGRLCVDHFDPVTICTVDNYARFWADCPVGEVRARLGRT